MEVNVSRLVTRLDPATISASPAELGHAAAAITWRNAQAGAARLLRPDQRDKARDFFAEFGAWSRLALAGMTRTEIDALVLQYAAGDLRELQSLAPGAGFGGIDWAKASELQEAGRAAGNLYVADGKLWINLD